MKRFQEVPKMAQPANGTRKLAFLRGGRVLCRHRQFLGKHASWMQLLGVAMCKKQVCINQLTRNLFNLETETNKHKDVASDEASIGGETLFETLAAFVWHSLTRRDGKANMFWQLKPTHISLLTWPHACYRKCIETVLPGWECSKPFLSG